MIVVTGGAGFIGSNIICDLNDSGIRDIVVVDRLGSEGKWRNLSNRQFDDVILPEELDDFLASSEKIDAVIHMGAISATTATDADEVIRSNFRLSAMLWKWCARQRVPLIYASSAATYGDGSSGFLDDASERALELLRPLNLYGWSKHAFDRWAIEQARRSNCPPQWIGLKFFNVYGPNEWHKGDMQSLVSKLAEPIQRGDVIKLFKSHRADFEDGGQLRDFVYVRDCSAAACWFLGQPQISGLFNLGTGAARSFRDLVLATGEAFGVDVSIEYVDMPLAIRNQYQYFTQADMNKLRSVGYVKPFCSLKEGAKDFVGSLLLKGEKYR